MMLPLPQLVGPVAVLVLLVGLLLAGFGRGMRRRRGLCMGQTVSLDRMTLTSYRLGLTGRPDRLVKTGGTIIPEEWKSSRSVRDAHRAQMGVYFLLIEDQMRIKPSHGFIVCGNGTRHRIDNSDELRAWVLELVAGIRSARAAIGTPIPVNPSPGQCRSCGQRENCSQAKA
jgi:CRISPR/Cas system-associated exonuclease Cas4 (RecB family)